MCDLVRIGPAVCETVEELEAAIGVTAVKHPLYEHAPRPESCLCGVDLVQTAKSAGLSCDLFEPGLYVFLKPGENFPESQESR